jgi:hypothetical protein
LKKKYLKEGILHFWQDIKEPRKAPPGGIQKFCFGESAQKRPTYCYKVGHGGRKILFVSAIHGNEIGTIKLARFLLDHLKCNEKNFEKLSCFVVPCLNVDGFKKAKGILGYPTGRRGRLNAHEVDLNRNFPTLNFRSRCYVLPKKNSLGTFKYCQEISLNGPEADVLILPKYNGGKEIPLKTKFCGDFGGSEPETRALLDLIEKENISVVFSFHNLGRDVMGGKDSLSKELVKIYAEKTGYSIMNDDEWRKIGQAGTAKDWCDDRNISFVEIEGSTRYGSDWKIQKPALEAVLEKLNAD